MATTKKRVRQVYDAEMVAHLWANQSQDSARTQSGNFSFQGETLCSYSTRIGRIYTLADGSKIALITSHCAAIWRIVERARKSGQPFIADPQTGPRIGHFRIDQITAEGNVVAGCHIVAYAEVRWLAEQLGLTTTAPHRKCECLRCGHLWPQVVAMSEYTQNISGEATTFCPSCGTKEVMAGPIES